MNRDSYTQLLGDLRTQIRADTAIAIGLYDERRAHADVQLKAIAAYQTVIPKLPQHLESLTDAVHSFYSTNSHRGWSQQFALRDLEKMESLWPVQENH
ncbi:MAG TPA: hypothetical protein VGH19_09345 [Verrucomicrobiae bacterium]